MSVFHRVDDVEVMCGATFFSRAQRLPFYDGAVRGRMLLEVDEQREMNVAEVPPVKNPNAKVVPSNRGALALNFPEVGVRTVKKAR